MQSNSLVHCIKYTQITKKINFNDVQHLKCYSKEIHIVTQNNSIQFLNNRKIKTEWTLKGEHIGCFILFSSNIKHYL